jgi:alkaline phosphatase
MKLRNQLLALFCLLVFVALGVAYFREVVAAKPFGIILFVSDGMVTRHLTAARLYEGGAEHRLAVDGFPHLALVRNAARDFAVPDAASAATALATGRKVNHRQLSVDAGGKPLATLLELAKKEGRSIGVVTNGRLTDPSLAAFYAHLGDSREEAAIAAQFAAAKLNVALGGGADSFQSPDANSQKSPNLVGAMQAQGRDIVRTKAELESAAAYREGGIVGLFSGAQLAHADQIEAGGQQPSLADMVRRAIEFLETNRSGYVLVVDAALVTQAAVRNEGERTIAETAALDHAIATAVKYAGDKSLVVAVGRHAVGGLSLNGFPLAQDHGVALLGVNPEGYPSITWATGPTGPDAAQTPGAKTEPAAFFTPAAVNTAEDVVAVGRGQGAEKLHGFIENTTIFDLLRDAL